MGERPVRVEYYGKRKGKGLIALRDFKQGDEIFHEEPLVCAPPFLPAQEKVFLFLITILRLCDHSLDASKAIVLQQLHAVLWHSRGDGG